MYGSYWEYASEKCIFHYFPIGFFEIVELCANLLADQNSPAACPEASDPPVSENRNGVPNWKSGLQIFCWRSVHHTHHTVVFFPPFFVFRSGWVFQVETSRDHNGWIYQQHSSDIEEWICRSLHLTVGCWNAHASRTDASELEGRGKTRRVI